MYLCESDSKAIGFWMFQQATGMVREGMRELGLLLGLGGGGGGNGSWGWDSLWRQQHARAQELGRLAAAAGQPAGSQVRQGPPDSVHLIVPRSIFW